MLLTALMGESRCIVLHPAIHLSVQDTLLSYVLYRWCKQYAMTNTTSAQAALLNMISLERPAARGLQLAQRDVHSWLRMTEVLP